MTGARLTSTAVMARRAEPADSLDFFPTPPWGTRALMKYVLPELIHPLDPAAWLTAWDPCAGEGHMALALGEQFREVFASDIFADGYGFGQKADFLHPDFRARYADWIVMNPPFNQGPDFVLKALELARVGVAVLVRTAFAEGQERYRALFQHRPPQIEAQFVERLPMHRGRWVVNGKTATAYCWMAWLRDVPHDRGRFGTRKIWIPPCRRQLSKHDDALNFSGVVDLPKNHRVLKLIADKERQANAPKPVSLADIRRELEERMTA